MSSEEIEDSSLDSDLFVQEEEEELQYISQSETGQVNDPSHKTETADIAHYLLMYNLKLNLKHNRKLLMKTMNLILKNQTNAEEDLVGKI